ncbi:MAG: DUF2304 domain-containing protein [Eggerthellaceae bacterium]|nr:DUF2304 domain-containing protein [Eggerthellaceae bacterium]
MLTLLLVAGAALTLVFIILKVRKSEIKTSDTVFWFILVLCLLILAIFPQIAFWLADVFDVQSPANLVFLVMVAVLLIKEFLASVEIAKLRSKVTFLVQELALMEVDGTPKPADEIRSVDTESQD